MKLRLLAVGKKMPGWVNEGFETYARRMPRECRIELVEIAPGARSNKDDPVRAMAVERDRLLDAAGNDHVVALDERGKRWSSPDLAQAMGGWLEGGRDVALMIGGADGLHADVRARADQSWSLSPAVYPHALVRVMVAEQLYRAWTLRTGHPYHR